MRYHVANPYKLFYVHANDAQYVHNGQTIQYYDASNYPPKYFTTNQEFPNIATYDATHGVLVCTHYGANYPKDYNNIWGTNINYQDSKKYYLAKDIANYCSLVEENYYPSEDDYSGTISAPNTLCLNIYLHSGNNSYNDGVYIWGGIYK